MHATFSDDQSILRFRNIYAYTLSDKARSLMDKARRCFAVYLVNAFVRRHALSLSGYECLWDLQFV